MYSKTLKFTVYSSLRPELICLRQHCMTQDAVYSRLRPELICLRQHCMTRDRGAACAAHSTDGMLTLKATVTSWVAT